MPTPTTTPTKQPASKEAPPQAAHAIRRDVAVGRADPRAPQAQELAEDAFEPYDNVACTD